MCLIKTCLTFEVSLENTKKHKIYIQEKENNPKKALIHLVKKSARQCT